MQTNSTFTLYSKILLEVESRDDSKWNYYGIYLPSNEERQGGWMDDYKMLHSYSLKSVVCQESVAVKWFDCGCGHEARSREFLDFPKNLYSIH